MNFLYKKIDWTKVQNVGFDIDGTLYDEYDFIVQVYREIARELREGSFEFMCKRWLEKGSSFNKIFDEAFDQFGSDQLNSKSEFIDNALNIFRTFDPDISLSNRTKSILDSFKSNFFLFIVTDGNPQLQKKKYASLGLASFFDKKHTIFTGDFDKSYEKPGTSSLEVLKVDPEKSVFFGDRENDELFAHNSGMQFVKISKVL